MTIKCDVCYNSRLHTTKQTRCLQQNCDGLAYITRNFRVDPGFKQGNSLTLLSVTPYPLDIFTDGVFLQMNTHSLTQ